VLFGQVSPAGRLPGSVPVGATPAYYDYKPSARRSYLFEEPGPLWPFGFGRSYTTFEYSGLAVKPARMPPDGHAVVSVTVKNTGTRASDEVVQLYIHDLVSSTTRPVQELKGFQRIQLPPGGTKRIEMKLGPAELSFFDRAIKRVVEPGRFDIMFRQLGRVGARARQPRRVGEIVRVQARLTKRAREGGPKPGGPPPRPSQCLSGVDRRRRCCSRSFDARPSSRSRRRFDRP
jgi:Fibronectin type III-like domain